MPAGLQDLPVEVVQQILRSLPAQSIAAFQRVCRKSYDVVDPLMWRHLCITSFRYWDEKHELALKLSDRVEEVQWRQLFLLRQSVDREATALLNEIVASQTGRLDKIYQVASLGYDAKDCLLRHANVGLDAQDVLAREYYSKAILDSIHRKLAVAEWHKSTRSPHMSLERALAAFDLFVLHERNGDFGEISSRLDGLAQEVIDLHPEFHRRTTREKALLVVAFLRANHLMGVQQDTMTHYHDLRNNFIGIALHHADHSSMPLISTALFCSVAQRLGVQANACAFMFHVVCIIQAPPGTDLDGQPVDTNSEACSMYLDPFQSDQEITPSSLVARLQVIGASPLDETLLQHASPTRELVLRTGRNILASVQEFHRHAIAANGGHNHVSLGSSFPDLEGAFYAALWASVLLGIPPNPDGTFVATDRMRNYIPPLIEHFEAHFPADFGLVEDYIAPLFSQTDEFEHIRHSVRVMRMLDSTPKHVKRRPTGEWERVKYRVGQVFRHRRYSYLAVVAGWDIECGANEQWMAQMGVHELTRGKHQSFYHVLVEDKSLRYVAEENIELLQPEAPQTLLRIAGRFFKRWDPQSKSFVSNIKDEYPDD